LERIKTSYQYLSEKEEAVDSCVVFMETSKDTVGEKFTQERSCGAYALVVGLSSTFADELSAVYQEAVDYMKMLITCYF